MSTSLKTGTVYGKFLSAPDGEGTTIPLVGVTALFEPDLFPRAIRSTVGDASVIRVPSINAATNHDGDLVMLGNVLEPGVPLIASIDPDIDPKGWTWTVTLKAPGLPPLQLTFTVSPDEEIDLATVLSVPSDVGAELLLWRETLQASQAASADAAASAALAAAEAHNASTAAAASTAAKEGSVAASIIAVSSANSVGTAATTATQRAAEAATSATAAATSATASATSATASATSATASAASQTVSGTSADTAAGSATAADASRAAAQAILDSINTSRGTPNGYAILDGTGKLPATMLPTSAMEYKGVWDASTNTPALTDAGGSQGDFYTVSVAGTRNLGSGSIDFQVKDQLIHNGTKFEKIDNTDAVTSVAGKTGAVLITKSDVGLGNVDNTADIDKPVSTATQTALNTTVNGATVVGHDLILQQIGGGTVDAGPVVTNLDIGTVTTGASGTQAAATLTGTTLDRNLNLTIPAGSTGPKPVLNTTSSTSNIVGTGTKTFTIDTPTDFAVGMAVQASSYPTPNYYITGTITAISPTSLTLSGTATGGTGGVAITSWTISLGGQRGSAGTTGATGSTGPVGPTGPAPILSTTSSTTNSIGTGARTFTIDTPTDFVVGMTIQATNASLNYITGTVTAVSATSITMQSLYTGGSSGTYTSWTLALSGNRGQTGATGATSRITSTSTTTNTISVSTLTFALVTPMDIAIGAWVTVSNSASLSQYVFGVVTAISATSITVAVTATGGSGTISSWIVQLAGVRGATGLTGSTGPAGPASTVPGPTGPAPNIQIGTVSTGASGTAAAATVTGTNPDYLLNLTLPQGATGPAGPSNLVVGPVNTLDPAQSGLWVKTDEAGNILDLIARII